MVSRHFGLMFWGDKPGLMFWGDTDPFPRFIDTKKT